VARRGRGETESRPWGFSPCVKRGGGVVDFSWRRGQEHDGGAASMARWIGRRNEDFAAKMGAVEYCEGVDALLLQGLRCREVAGQPLISSVDFLVYVLKMNREERIHLVCSIEGRGQR
jgi:hypothetical protein